LLLVVGVVDATLSVRLSGSPWRTPIGSRHAGENGVRQCYPGEVPSSPTT